MAKQNPPGPRAGEPRQRRPPGAAPAPRARRAATGLTWWVLLMSLWVAVDDSLAADALLVGAGAAALAALAAELACHQAEVRFRARARWFIRVLRLPGEVAAQTALVFAALARTLFTRAHPPGGAFEELPVAYGDDTPLGVTRRVLLTGAHSLAPNDFVVGIDPARDTMTVHRLVGKR